MAFVKRLSQWLRRHPVVAVEGNAPEGQSRGPVDLIVILDGTMSTLVPGKETNAGLTFRLLAHDPHGKAGRRVYYEPGLQWEGWRRMVDVIVGRGINRQIRRAYGWLASQYREGDRIYLIGYSRGAFAVRSLAGVIDRVGLLRRAVATERNVTLAYRHYQLSPDSDAARNFAQANCHATCPIRMLGVWDTVKALGWRVPGLWMLTQAQHEFHNHQISRTVENGFHALAMDETRRVFAPVLWDCPESHLGRVQQVWFRGAHADIGGQIGDFVAARPLANIPLVWMLERAENCGLVLPPDWRDRFVCDASAPSVGTWRAWGKIFILRWPRQIGRDPSESIHPTARLAPARRAAWPLRLGKAVMKKARG